MSLTETQQMSGKAAWQRLLVETCCDALRRILECPEYARDTDVFAVLQGMMRCQQALPHIGSLLSNVAQDLEARLLCDPAMDDRSYTGRVEFKSAGGNYVCLINETGSLPVTAIIPARYFDADAPPCPGQRFCIRPGSKHAEVACEPSTVSGPNTMSKETHDADAFTISDEIRSDIEWALAERARTGFAGWKENYVAILNREVVGDGDSEEQLRARLSTKYGVPPGRFIVEFKGEW